MSSSTEKAERPIYLWPNGADLSMIKSAVLELGLPFKVRPFWYEPGKHPRAIALAPGFVQIADHAYPKTIAAAKASVLWALEMSDLPQAHTVKQKMEKVFGSGIREVDPDDVWGSSNKPVIGRGGGWEWPS